MFSIFRRKQKPISFTDAERIVLFTQRLHGFNERMAEERRKRGHIVYPKGVSIHPSMWPACPPNCEHVTGNEITETAINPS